MINSIRTDQKRRSLFKKYEHERALYKAIIQDQKLPQALRYEFIIKLNKLPRNSSIIRKKDRCVITGRSKGNLKYFKMSRICLRELVATGSLSGVTKASW